METERPVVRLRPTVPPHPFRGGGLTGTPWAYQDQIVLDRRTRALPAGSIVELQDGERRPIGCADRKSVV